MAAQRVRLIFGAEQTSLLQNRDDQLDEIVQGTRDIRLNNESVCRFLQKPMLNQIGNMLGSADELAFRCRRIERGLAQCPVFFPRLLLDFVCRAAEAVAAYLAQLWKRFVQRILGKIMVVKKSAQIMQRLLNADQTGKLRVLALGFIVCFADNRVDPGENQDVIFASAIGCAAARSFTSR